MGLISYVKEEMQVIMERDAAIKTPMEVFLYPSFKVMIHYRLAHKLYVNEQNNTPVVKNVTAYNFDEVVVPQKRIGFFRRRN